MHTLLPHTKPPLRRKSPTYQMRRLGSNEIKSGELKQLGDLEMDKALEALHVAAQALRQMAGVQNVSVDNDADSGEIFFAVGDIEYKLKLEEIGRRGTHVND